MSVSEGDVKFVGIFLPFKVRLFICAEVCVGTSRGEPVCLVFTSSCVCSISASIHLIQYGRVSVPGGVEHCMYCMYCMHCMHCMYCMSFDTIW